MAALCSMSASGTLEFGGSEVAAAPTEQEIESAIRRGVVYLKSRNPRYATGGDGLVAYALLSAGTPLDDPVVQGLIDRIKAKVRKGAYTPGAHHFYEAGLDLMALGKADSELYRDEIEAVARYIIDGQLETGAWFYPHRPPQPGDTSITQYAALGLWAASRAGIEVSPNVWSNLSRWLIETQFQDGSFTYHPPRARPGSMPTMTVAALGSQYIARLHLTGAGAPVIRPEHVDGDAGRGAGVVEEKKKFGVLEEIGLDRPVESIVIGNGANRGRRTGRTSIQQIDESIARGLEWLAANYSPDMRDMTWKLYYLYALERMAALGDIADIGGNNWYADGSTFLLRTQRDEGHWSGRRDPSVGTSFALLFLSRATSRLLNRGGPGPTVGGGLLAGGRGLPENLSEVQLQGSEIKVQQLSGPIGALLAELENPQSVQVEQAQAGFVEQVQLGDREELIGQKERLLELLDDPRAEVRRTAVWALGRSGDIALIPHLIVALQDPAVSVMVEARNALCWISRQPGGLGLPHSPLDSVPLVADEGARRSAIELWRADAVARWRQWYSQVRPYNQRDRLDDR